MTGLSTERATPPVKSPHQLAPGLAPLEYLQLNQRRGSITDPSLHASAHHHQPDQSPPRHPLSSSFTTHRSNSYSFPPVPKANEGELQRSWSAQDSDTMETDALRPLPGKNGSALDSSRPNSNTFLPPPAFTGSKRKMSHDRQAFQYPEDLGANPNGANYPSALNGASYGPNDLEGPNPKRRGSTFETGNRIAHLSLQDRRDSVDSRSSLPMGGNQWPGDRRDSVYSTTSMGSSIGGYSTTSPGRSLFTIASPISHIPIIDGSMDPHNHHPPPARGFTFPQDPVGNGNINQSYNLPPVPPIPSVHYSASVAAARRLSIPESSLPLNGIKSRNRGASRSSRGTVANVPPAVSNDAVTPPMAEHASPTESQRSPGPSDGTALITSPNSGHLLPPGARKETPYSRSPELRVSHKMAERKRRKEMKDLFDELRDQLPADRGMKASKWEILSKAVDYIAQLKVAYSDMAAEIERLRGDGDGVQRPPAEMPFVPRRNYDGSHSPDSGPTSLPPISQNGGHRNYDDRGRADSGSPNGQHGDSPYASHHATPTPQQPSQSLPSTMDA